jgi:hypothetical protein
VSRLTELQQEAEWRRCERDESYFLHKYWHIAHPAHGKLDLDEAVRLLKELEPYMEDRNLFKKAMFDFGR